MISGGWGGGVLSYERGREARRLAQCCKFRILGLGHAQIGLLLGAKFKISEEHPPLSNENPPSPGRWRRTLFAYKSQAGLICRELNNITKTRFSLGRVKTG